MIKQDIPTHKYGLSRAYISSRRIKVDVRYSEVAHRHNFFQVLFIEEGSGAHEIDFVKYKTIPNSFHFVGKGRVHRVDFGEETKGDVFTFPEELFSGSETEMQLLNSLSFFRTGADPILKPATADLADLNEMLIQVRKSLKTKSLDISKFLFLAFLARLREAYSKKVTQPTSTVSSEFNAFRNTIKLIGLEANNIDEIASSLKIQVTRLNQICKKETGKTALQLLHERKVLGAKRMLVYTSKQIKEVSLECGFVDVAYFNRFFKKHTGLSPSQFKAEYKSASD
ncbi:MAG: helix-turn-helix domain-containing protein [Salibacteraceae bacterium]|nr:helix-turn-helix domain-containing protein [Salibacteraceae bacterium]